jgi:TATA-box binding protein (TBP) (component of TFIID and TFIIIB)
VSSVEEGDYTREDYPAAVTALERAGEAVYVCTSGAVHKVRMVSE